MHIARVSATHFSPPEKSRKGRVRDIARALVCHPESINTVEIRRRFKRWRAASGAEPTARSEPGDASLRVRSQRIPLPPNCPDK